MPLAKLRLSCIAGASANPKARFNRKTGMPYINLQITKGATRDQKAAIVREFTDTLVRVLGKKPEHTHIVIQEIEDQDWGFAGMLTDDFRKQESET